MNLQTPAQIVVEGIPTNLRLPVGSRGTHVDSDLHQIASRIREIDPRYTLTLLEHVDGDAIWVVSEPDDRGQECLVFRVGPGCAIDALDGRVIERLNYLRSVPLEQRMREAEAEAQKQVDARREQEREKLWETLGAPMYANLARLGFIDVPRTESFRPQNRAARRAGRKL